MRVYALRRRGWAGQARVEGRADASLCFAVLRVRRCALPTAPQHSLTFTTQPPEVCCCAGLWCATVVRATMVRAATVREARVRCCGGGARGCCAVLCCAAVHITYNTALQHSP